MAGSFNKIDYRLRPAKHAERVMLCDLLRRMRFASLESYQYVGFGSVAFVDFRMIHRALGIKEMLSIEGSDDDAEQERFRKNKPYDGLKLEFGNSSSVLPNIDFEKKSIVWLDYDDLLTRSMATDLGIVARNIVSGSFLGVTFTADFPADRATRDGALDRLKAQFPEFVPEDAKAGQFVGPGIAEFGRATLGALLGKALEDADAGRPSDQKRQAIQVCFFRYADGAPMATVGWIVVAAADLDAFEASNLQALPFYRSGSDSFRIRMPLVTPYEIREMERTLPDLDAAANLNWIPLKERKAFGDIYRYLPHFAVMEPTG